MTITSPYGTWRSPITARDIAASGHPVQGGCWVGEQAWWCEGRPEEGGRYVVANAAGDVLPAPWNARSRVHEYGGGAWAVTADRALVFAEFSDQRLYRLDDGGSVPVPLTPAGLGFRFGDISIRGSEVIAVREIHADGSVTRDIVAVPLDGTGAVEGTGAVDGIRSLASGSHFLAFPRFSPDGARLAWIGWEHPQMPWDGTELRVTELESGTVSTLAGSATESVLQPEWIDDATLTMVSDRSGWWNLYSVTLHGEVASLHREEADFGGPLWQLGNRFYDLLDDGRILAVRTLGSDDLVIVDPADGTSQAVDLSLTGIRLGPRRGSRVLLTGGSSAQSGGLRVFDLDDGSLTDLRWDVESMPDAAYVPIAKARTFLGARDVHSFVYPPRNGDYDAPAGERPPYIAVVHGGPTGHSSGGYSPIYSFFTSRGIGIIDVNYGGSTGYGREYRNRLRGQWGVVDVEDVIAAVLGLADAGLADATRLAIRGGSAGGFTVLAALTRSSVFAAGASYYGVSDLATLAAETHDFESRYTDGLVGPLPEASALYAQRSPITHVNDLTTPVLLLQGLDDEIVPPAQSELFRDQLAAQGLPHAYLAYEGESHGFRRAETIVDATESELSFYGQVMGFDPPDVPRLTLS
jgi:dipeptidyl aminopeptidase/acylaminoacyl peptidase